jgi:hypothetical protein
MGKRNQIDVGASSAHRWSRCTASPKFIVDNADQLPEDSTFYADEGTEAHEVAAVLLDGKGLQPGTSAEMLRNVMTYVDHVRSHQKSGARLSIEKRVPLFYLNSRNGIVDAATQSPDALYIDDLKYGVGVSVEAEGNEQLAIYGESMIRQWELITEFSADFPVHLSIVQPRDRNNPVAVRTWSLTRRELSTFTTQLGAKALQALRGEGEFAPSDEACKFCPAKGICAAYGADGLVALPEEARVITLPDPGVLTREQRVKALKAKNVLRDWMDALLVQEISDLMAGAEPMGFKLVEGKANRTWVDTDAALKLLNNHLTIDELRPRADLISPAQAEKALKGRELSTKFQNKFKGLITRPEGKPTLVPEDDKRPALQAGTSFQNLDVI